MKTNKIGIIMNSLTCSRYLYDTIMKLRSYDDIQITLLLEDDVPELSILRRIFYKIRKKGFFRTISLAAFKVCTKVEGIILSRTNEEVRDHFSNYYLRVDDFDDVIHIRTIFSNKDLLDRYSNGVINNLKYSKFDLFVRGNGGAIFKGDILNASRLGIVSLHHGDNRWYRGGPPAFWEVYHRRPSTGFAIQLLTEEHDEGRVLYRVRTATKRTYTENLASLCKQSFPFYCELIREILDGCQFVKEENENSFDEIILKTPKFWETINYVNKTIFLLSRLFFQRRILNRRERWGVAYLRSHWLNANLSKGVIIKNPKGRFFADPFVMKRGDNHFIFVEDYNFKLDRGSISCVVVDEHDGHRIIRDVISEDFHLSFPFIFEDGNELFMIPESSADHSIRLYRCVEFPDKWELYCKLIDDVFAVDTMVFKEKENWYIMTNLNQYSSDFGSQLHILFSDILRSGNWKSISDLPIFNDSMIGRNGGCVRDRDGTLCRVRQAQGFARYGASFSVAKIKRLSPEFYEEEQILAVSPNFFKGLIGCHHMHGAENFTVYDYARESNPSRGV